MNTESPPLPSIIWKLSKQCALTAILALFYAYWDYINAQQQNVPTFLKSFGVAFFLIMWFEGLFMRASKQVSDAASFAAIHGDVTAIRTQMPEKDDVIAFITKTYAQRDGQGQDLLIVVDIQKDFCKDGVLEVYDSESIIDSLNRLIYNAEQFGHKVVYTRDWHPPKHQSFDIRGGPWPPHCVQNTDGAAFHDRLRVPGNATIVNIGSEPESLGYSAFEDDQLAKIAIGPNIRHIYVAGIALNYCVLATCLEARKYGKPVIALEPYIRPAKADERVNQRLWNELTEHGIIRSNTMGTCYRNGA